MLFYSHKASMQKINKNGNLLDWFNQILFCQISFILSVHQWITVSFRKKTKKKKNFFGAELKPTESDYSKINWICS